MSEDLIHKLLSQCSQQQLDAIHQALEKKAAEKAAAESTRLAQQRHSSPPRTNNDVEKMAEGLGLDLSSLMREISKR